MKTVFNINNNESRATSTARVIVISEEQLAYIYYSNSPLEVQQIKIFSLDRKEGNAQLAAQLRDLFTAENAAHSDVHETSIYVNNKELTLVPQTLHIAENAENILNLIFGEDVASTTQNENLPNTEIQMLYRTPNEVNAVVGEFYPGIKLQHSIGKQFKMPLSSAPQIFCLVGYSYAKIFVFDKQEFLLQRYFHYATADDMAYQLLNTCTQLNLDLTEVEFKLSGFIEANSNLYAALHKYFLNIEFENVAEAVQINTAAEAYPQHMFFPLYQLLPNENY